MIRNIQKIGLLLALTIGGALTGHSQIAKERKADKEFETLAYIDAISVYERIAEKGHINTSVLQKLGDANYFNGKLTAANKWYAQLFESDYPDKDISSLSSEYYYRYAQTLRAMQDYQRADQIMAEFAKLEAQDSRVALYQANKNYRESIKEMPERYQVQNLEINSEYSDYGATLLENKLVFTSARETATQSKSRIHSWTGESYTSLYTSEINPDGSFSEPEKFSKDLDSKVNDATAVFTSDGKTMYFTRNNSNTSGRKKRNKANESLLKIYKARLNDKGEWDNVEALPFNSDNFNTAHPALTSDGKWLYFSSDREGTLGQSDIFRVAIYELGGYSEPENVGSVVNTSGRETFPFISEENLLFFASDGHPGLGGLDVFVSRINADGSISEVTNMGSPINSSMDDFGFYINQTSGKGFVSSNRQGGKGSDDIYFFKEKPCEQVITGIVYDNHTQAVLKDAKVILSDAMYQSVDTLYTDAEGRYRSKSKACGVKYRLQAVKENYTPVELVLQPERTNGERVVNIGLDPIMEPVKVNDDLFKKLKLQPIYFDFDKSNIRPDAAIELAKVVEVMKAYPTMKVDVRSHTDSRGNDAYNMKLSDRRAKSTIKWMIQQGIQADRLTGKGYGESQLLNNCSNGVPCSVEEHQLNRRSEFIVTEL
ncbi:OmpA family protein [Myroides pelagicus]|uniref:OmpA family protein n=1 Tax=Myroides pelagicus TaxID=270914 RepID=A0A7K1GMX3_9FLAO|nr:OmpA family protein [Myroides pelagicus]MTH29733.1 OmpA family protein [Myroides pelagicus]